MSYGIPLQKKLKIYYVQNNAWKIKKDKLWYYHIWEIEKYGKMLMLQFISGRLISFWNLFIYVNNSQYTIYINNIWWAIIRGLRWTTAWVFQYSPLSIITISQIIRKKVRTVYFFQKSRVRFRIHSTFIAVSLKRYRTCCCE